MIENTYTERAEFGNNHTVGVEGVMCTVAG